MSLRGRVVAGTVVAGLVVLGALAWPLVEDQAARALERRLAAETGRPWTVGGVSLEFLPKAELVARDVTVADVGGGSGKLRRIRLSDPFALLGSGGKVQAVAEGLELRLPTTQPGRTAGKVGDVETRPSGTLASLRALVRGASAELAESGRTLVASAESVDLTLDLADAAPRTDIQVRFETGTYGLDLAAVLAAGGKEAAPLTLNLEPRSGNGHRVQATASAAVGPDALRLDALAGTIDGEPFSGSLELGVSAKPRIALDLRLDALALVDAAAPPPAAQGQGLVVPVKPDFVPDVRWFEGFDGKGSVSVARLRLGSAALTGVTLTGTVKDGTLDAALASAALYEGQARGRYVLGPDASRTGRHQVSLSLSRLRVLPFLSDIAGVRGLDGSGAARLDVQASGARAEDLLRSATGSADLSVTDGRIDGLDLASAFGLLPGRDGARPAGSLATRLDRLAGRFDIADGQAFTNDLQLKTALIEATGIGRIDVLGRSLDFRFKPQVAQAGGGQGRPRARLDVPVRVSGSWTSPNVSADLSGLAENPAGAIQSLQDLGSNLLGEEGGGGNLGESLGGLIDSFIPRSDAPKPDRSQPGRRRSLSPEPEP